MAPTLSRTERRLHERVKELLPAEEEVLAAIVVWTGSKPWREGLYTLISGLLGQLPGRPAGPYFTLAVTNQGVVRFRNRGTQRPAQLLDRYPLDQLHVVTSKWGEISIELDRDRYSTQQAGSELGRLQRLLKQGQ